MPEERRCERCGEPFTPQTTGIYCERCRKERRVEDMRRYQAERWAFWARAQTVQSYIWHGDSVEDRDRWFRSYYGTEPPFDDEIVATILYMYHQLPEPPQLWSGSAYGREIGVSHVTARKRLEKDDRFDRISATYYAWSGPYTTLLRESENPVALTDAIAKLRTAEDPHGSLLEEHVGEWKLKLLRGTVLFRWERRRLVLFPVIEEIHRAVCEQPFYFEDYKTSYEDNEPSPEERIVSLLEERGEADLQSIAERLGVAQRDARERLQVMERRGEIHSRRAVDLRKLYSLEGKRRDETEELILDELRTAPSSIRELARRLDVHYHTVAHRLNELEADGLIEHERDGRSKVFRVVEADTREE